MRRAAVRVAAVALLFAGPAAADYEGWKVNEVSSAGYVTGEATLWIGEGTLDECLEKAVANSADVAQWNPSQSWCETYKGISLGVCQPSGTNCVSSTEYRLFQKPTATPSPTDLQETEKHTCGTGCVTATVVLTIFWAIALTWLAYWYRDEWSLTGRRLDIAAQMERARQKEEGEEVATADVHGELQKARGQTHGQAEEGEEDDWRDVKRYDKFDHEAVAEHRFKTFSEFSQCTWVVNTFGPVSERTEAQAEDVEKLFRSLETREERLDDEEWAVKEMVDLGTPWNQLTPIQKVEHVIVTIGKIVGIFGVLYMFIIALGLMGDAFKVIGGRTSGRTFRDSELIANPVAAIAIGILATVLMQSSSTTTSIVISMAAADLVKVKDAAFLVMGANIGTSVTNTIVSLAHINTPDEYRRAFAGATFHDMFNWLTVLVFAPLEIASGFLMELAAVAVDSMDLAGEEKRGKVDIIKKITKPAAGRIISVDKKLIEKIAKAKTSEEVDKLEAKTIIKQSSGHVFRDSPISDDEVGGLMIFVSLAMLCTCLLLLVRLLQSVLRGKVAHWSRFLLNLEFDNWFCRQAGGLDNYILLLFGCGCTIIVQSSSVFTSTITPLVGIGLIHIEKLTALTHGANIGTTVTGVLSALSNSNMVVAMQVALEHVFFNAIGTVLWYCIWPLRPVPLAMSKFMGRSAMDLNWFPLAYIVVCFLATPALVIGVSVPGWESSVGVLLPLALLIASIGVIVYLRRNNPKRLAECLRSDTMCGCNLPNWLRVERDEDADRVDLEALKAKEAEEARVRKLTMWDYGPLVWGLNLLGFLALMVALPTSQWRRVRYGIEPTRNEWGIGLFETCQKDFGKDVMWMQDPDSGCTEAALHSFLVSQPQPNNPTHPLVEQCTTNTSFAVTYSSALRWEIGIYESAWDEVRNSRKCGAQQWRAACESLPACTGRAGNAKFCLESDKEWVQRYTEVTYDYSKYQRLTTGASPVSNAFPTKAASSLSVSRDYSWASQSLVGTVQSSSLSVWAGAQTCAARSSSSDLCNDAPSGTALTWDPCTGEMLWVSGAAPEMRCTSGGSGISVYASPYQPAGIGITVDGVSMTAAASGWERVTESSGSAVVTTRHGSAGETEYSDTSCTTAVPASPSGLRGHAVAHLPGGRLLVGDANGPKLVVLDSARKVVANFVPQGSTMYDSLTGVQKVLPSEFLSADNSRAVGFEAVAVKGAHVVGGGSVKAYACLRASLRTGSRVVRCVVLDVTDTSAPVLDSERLLLQSTAEYTAATRGEATTQVEVQTRSAFWLGSDSVAVLETGRSAGTAVAHVIMVVDFGTGDDIKGLTAAQKTLAELELLGAEVGRLLSAKQAAPMAVRKAVDLNNLASTVNFPRTLGGLVVPNEYTLVLSEDNNHGVNASYARLLVVQLDEALAEVSSSRYQCAESTYALAWSKISRDPADGALCKDTSEWCSAVADDMAAVAGLAITGTVFHSLGTAGVIVFTLFGANPMVRKLIYVSVACLGVGWIMLLAAWGRLLAMEKTEYTCPFVHDTGSGAVLVTGELGHLTHQSYSWALCIFAWCMNTIAFPFVVAKAVSVFRGPADAGELEIDRADEKKKEIEPVEMSEPAAGAPAA